VLGPYDHRTSLYGQTCRPEVIQILVQVAVLDAPNPAAPGGRTTVYVLGMSHVSQRSCEDIEQLVRLVRPDVVLLELCKDRVTGLISKDQVSFDSTHHKQKTPSSGRGSPDPHYATLPDTVDKLSRNLCLFLSHYLQCL